MKHKLYGDSTITIDGTVTSRLGRQIKQQMSNSGYLRVELFSHGAGKKFLVHRLLAAAFIPNPENKETVNHIDGDKSNNSIGNLEWATRSENQIHAYKTGLQLGHHVSGKKISESHKAALCGSRWFGTTRTYHAEGLTFNTPKDAADHFGISRQSFYNRAKSCKFQSWKIKILKEVENER